jgi:hypothetical protein
MDIELEQEVIAAIESGQKIDAIKSLRRLRRIGLKEAKELVDLYCSQNSISTFPVQKEKSGSGFILLIILCIVGYGIYHYLG